MQTSPRIARRAVIALAPSFVPALAIGMTAAFAPRASAQATDVAQAFIDKVATDLQQIVNGPATLPEKQKALQKIIDANVDVEDIGRFCLGRFWRSATPQQQHEYLELFHRVLMLNITSKVADYQGVSFTMGRSAPREGDVAVSSVITRPGNAPAKVDWLVSTASGGPKIIDVIAEGTSLRLTQRSDYASFMSRNGNSVQALIDALRQQAAGQTPG